MQKAIRLVVLLGFASQVMTQTCPTLPDPSLTVGTGTAPAACGTDETCYADATNVDQCYVDWITTTTTARTPSQDCVRVFWPMTPASVIAEESTGACPENTHCEEGRTTAGQHGRFCIADGYVDPNRLTVPCRATWVSNGFCTSTGYTAAQKCEYCPNYCGQCGVTTVGYDATKKKTTAKVTVKATTTKATVKTTVKPTTKAKVCPADNNANCVTWAANGFCTNPGYTAAQIASYCSSACKTC